MVVQTNTVLQAVELMTGKLDASEEVVSINYLEGDEWLIIEGEQVNGDHIKAHPELSAGSAFEGDANNYASPTPKKTARQPIKRAVESTHQPLNTGANRERTIVYSSEALRYSPLSKLFFVLAALSICGGLFLCIEFWPGDPPEGMEWTNQAYTLSLMSIVAGVVQFAIYTAIGQALSYLKKIADNSGQSSDK